MASARSTLYAVMLVSFLGTAGIALPYPLLSPLFLDAPSSSGITQFLGLPPTILLGIVLALYPFGMLIGGSFIGALSDVYGRKPILLVTMFIAVLGYLLTGYAAAEESYALFAFARFMTGLCEGNIAVSRAVALDLHPEIDRNRSVALVYSTVYAGWLVGPLFGGYVASYGVDTVFYVAGLVTLVAMVPVQIALKRRGPDRPREGSVWKAMSRDNSLRLLKVREIRPLIIYHQLYTLGLNAFYEFYPVWLVERWSFGSVAIGWATFSITLAMVLASVFGIGALTRRIPGLGLVIVGNLVLGGTFLLVPLSGPHSVFAIFALCGALIALTNTVFPAHMSERFEEHGQGRVMGLLTTSFCFTNVVMAILGSIVAVFNPSWPLLTAGMLCVTASFWLRVKGGSSVQRAEPVNEPLEPEVP